MISPEQQNTDGFWNVQAQEERAKKEVTDQIEALSRVINLGRRALALRGQTGFEDFVKSVADLREHAKNQLVASTSTDQEMRILQGKAQALSDVLALLRDTERSVEALEARREQLQNRLAEAVTADGKLKPEPIGGKA